MHAAHKSYYAGYTGPQNRVICRTDRRERNQQKHVELRDKSKLTALHRGASSARTLPELRVLAACVGTCVLSRRFHV